MSGNSPATASVAANPAPSFTTGRNRARGCKTVKLVHPTAQKPTTLTDLSNDPFLAFPYLHRPSDCPKQVQPAKERATYTTPGVKATEALSSRRFDLAWSGVKPPPGFSGEQPEAASLSDEGPAELIDKLDHIVAEYLVECPEERTLLLEDGLAPGPDGDAIRYSDDMPELFLTWQLKDTYFYMANALLALFHRAVCWYARQPRGRKEKAEAQVAHPWPVPLDGPLSVGTQVKANVEQADVPKEAATVHPDFAVRWHSGAPGVNLGVGEVKHHLSAEGALQWTAPTRRPLDPLRSSRPRKKRKLAPQEQHGYLVDSDEDKLAVQTGSQLLLHNATCGAMLADFGRLLILYELRRVEREEEEDDDDDDETAPAYALCFAKEAIYSFAATGRAQEVAPSDRVESFHQRYGRSAEKLGFTSTPAMVWALVHWALWTFHVAARQGCMPLPAKGKAADRT